MTKDRSMMSVKRRDFLIGAGVLAASPALAQEPPASPPPAPVEALAPPAPGMVRVALNTGQGVIVLDLNQEKAPITTANFLRYVDQKRYDGSTFYRASRPPNATTADYGVIQGGLENNPAKVLKPIAHEPTTKTGLKHLDGTISMGRHAPGTATSDFFICIGDSKYLDADPAAPGDNLGYAAFGQVVQGMDVVKKILVLPTSPTKGVGPMKGQMLEPRVPIKTARRVVA
jgi:peptidyl-prolyl cis-trans isomerase A (cyclophilin A)